MVHPDTKSQQDLCKTSIGAIRWDAWFGELSDVGLMVEKTLGPRHYHHRLPFYASELSDSDVEVRGASQVVMDQEIVYAISARLDYWAFVVYPQDNPLSLGLQLYLNSAVKGNLHFCLNLQGGWMGDPASWLGHIARYVEYFKDPMYQRVGARPLVYIFMAGDLFNSNHFGSPACARSALNDLREACIKAGLDTPYIVIQDWSPSDAADYCRQLGADAVGAYAAGNALKPEPFAALAEHTEKWWDIFRATDLPVVPLVSSGWDPRPRIETRVPWHDYGSIDCYYDTPTPQEFAYHLRSGLAWVRNHPQTATANTVLIYAWNEFDEGGWICPTLTHGTDRLDAIKEVIHNSFDPLY
jgi:hypothetical protein